ncbi:MAG: tetratricopeptide repeat protein [Rhodobacteraceae bacterium]|nr:tetratricopeptide repeat protein [Paracoccaceae bacterium]
MSTPPTASNSTSDTADPLQRGFEFLENRHFKDAVAFFVPLVSHRPGDVRIRMALGSAYVNLGQFDAAAVNFLKASRVAPEMAEPRLALAMALADGGKLKDGLSVLVQTSSALPDDAAVWSARGGLERKLGRDADAEKSFRQSLALAPDSVDTLNNLAVVVRAQGRIAEAISLYEKALANAPDTALLHANLGNAYDLAGETAKAEHHLRRAVEIDPELRDARHNLAAHLIRAERQDEAIPLLEWVVARDPDRWDSLTNLGVATLAVGHTDDAERYYRKAISLRPDVPETHYDLAWVLLLTGSWQEGWQEYEWRWKLPTFTSRRPSTDLPEWDGADMPGGTLLIYAEQGFGDCIQFARYALLAKRRVSSVVLVCPRPLLRLVRTIPEIDAVAASDEKTLPRADAQVAVMSLPLIFQTTPDTVPYPKAYVPRPVPDSKIRLPNHGGRPRIGIVWAGSPDNKIDRQRNCDVAHFKSLIGSVDADFVSLQVGPRAQDLGDWAHPRLIYNADGNVGDFLDTAGLIAQLDLVVGVDTAVMHLAASMGIPTWVMLPYMPDYRWLLGRSDSPWYKCVRLFRQNEKGVWDQVFTDIIRSLTDWSPAAS